MFAGLWDQWRDGGGVPKPLMLEHKPLRFGEKALRIEHHPLRLEDRWAE